MGKRNYLTMAIAGVILVATLTYGIFGVLNATIFGTLFIGTGCLMAELYERTKVWKKRK